MTFVLWLVLAIFVGMFADNKGRSGIGFFFLAVLLSPLIGFLIAIAVKPNRDKAEAKKMERVGLRKCPFCVELIKFEAAVCKHCGRDVPAPQTPENPGPNAKSPSSASKECARCGCRNYGHLEFCNDCASRLP